MATQATEQAPAAEGTEVPAPATNNKKMILTLGGGGLRGGGAVGLFVVGPMLAKKRAAAPPPKPAAEAAATPVVHAIENLVLNPAGTGGARFLMATATFELKDGGVDQ